MITVKKLKAIIALLLAAMTVLALTACGGENTKPVITSQPESQTAAEGTVVKFTVGADGEGLTYQWYYRTSSTGKWKASTLDNATTSTLKVKAISDRDGYQYKCTVTTAEGSTDSEPATLTVLGGSKNTGPVITAQPENQTAAEDTVVKFTVEADGDNLTYQWYYRTSPTGKWKESTLDTAKHATLKVKAIPDRNGYQYMCTVTSAEGSTDSEPATLTVE